jgi:transposase
MAAERLTMRHLRDILRQKWTLGLSHRAVARSLGVGLGTISSALARAEAAGVDWSGVQGLSDDELERRLYRRPADPAVPPGPRPWPDCTWIHAERRKPGVTLELLHLEYLERHPADGYRYTQFCDIYRRWLRRRGLTMRQVHRAGEKCFVDYAGQKPRLIDPATGEVVEVELFAAVLGASNYTYAEATRTQQGPDWIASHARALVFFGGVPAAIVCDQLKSGVVVPCRYEPGVQRTYEEFAQHVGSAILPARPGRARDKAKVEVAVQVAERWILARLRHETFFSLAALNARIAELLVALNARRMRLYGASRQELFLRLEQPVLRPLPAEPFIYGTWTKARVNIDYHIEIEHHYYSVPYPLAHEVVEVRVSAATVEAFHRGQRVAAHPRSPARGRHTTLSTHMPKAHQHHLEWTPSRLTEWAATIGPQTAALAAAILADRPHPEQGYRSCLGLLRLSRRVGPERLEAAAARALLVGARSYRHVDAILKHGLDRVPLEPAVQLPLLPAHEHLRGRDYYQ